MSVSEIGFEPSSVSITMWTKLTPSSSRNVAYRKLSGWRSLNSVNTFSTSRWFSSARSGLVS